MDDIEAAKSWPEKSRLIEYLATDLAVLAVMAADEKQELFLSTIQQILRTLKQTWAAVMERRDSLAACAKPVRIRRATLSIGA